MQSEKIQPLEIIKALNKSNIESRPVWKPLHKQPVFRKYKYIGTNIAENLYRTGLCLPSDTKMTIEEQEKVISIIKGLW